MDEKLNKGIPFYVTHTHATAAVASHAAVDGYRHFITDISASSDKAGAILLVKQGTTTIWQDIVNAGNYNHSFRTPLIGEENALVSAQIDGTAAAKVNIAGVAVKQAGEGSAVRYDTA